MLSIFSNGNNKHSDSCVALQLYAGIIREPCQFVCSSACFTIMDLFEKTDETSAHKRERERATCASG